MQASSFVDALVHKFDIAVAGEADRDIAQEGLEFGVYPLQIVIVRIGHDELADFFFTADEIEALRFDRHIAHASVEEGFFIGCDIRDIDDITRIDMHTLTVCTAATENPVGQVERNGIPEKGSAALIFRNMGPIKTNDILVRLVVVLKTPSMERNPRPVQGTNFTPLAIAAVMASMLRWQIVASLLSSVSSISQAMILYFMSTPFLS